MRRIFGLTGIALLILGLAAGWGKSAADAAADIKALYEETVQHVQTLAEKAGAAGQEEMEAIQQELDSVRKNLSDKMNELRKKYEGIEPTEEMQKALEEGNAKLMEARQAAQEAIFNAFMPDSSTDSDEEMDVVE